MGGNGDAAGRIAVQHDLGRLTVNARWRCIRLLMSWQTRAPLTQASWQTRTPNYADNGCTRRTETRAGSSQQCWPCSYMSRQTVYSAETGATKSRSYASTRARPTDVIWGREHHCGDVRWGKHQARGCRVRGVIWCARSTWTGDDHTPPWDRASSSAPADLRLMSPWQVNSRRRRTRVSLTGTDGPSKRRRRGN